MSALALFHYSLETPFPLRVSDPLGYQTPFKGGRAI